MSPQAEIAIERRATRRAPRPPSPVVNFSGITQTPGIRFDISATLDPSATCHNPLPQGRGPLQGKALGLKAAFIWRPRRDLNPCYRRERAVSWAGLDDGDAGIAGASTRLNRGCGPLLTLTGGGGKVKGTRVQGGGYRKLEAKRPEFPAYWDRQAGSRRISRRSLRSKKRTASTMASANRGPKIQPRRRFTVVNIDPLRSAMQTSTHLMNTTYGRED
jgi:hypothetical protein